MWSTNSRNVGIVNASINTQTITNTFALTGARIHPRAHPPPHTHTHTYPHITKPQHTQTHTYTHPHTHTHTHITKPTHTHPHTHIPTHYKTPTYTHAHTHTHTPTHYKTHTYTHLILQNNLIQPQYKLHTNTDGHFSEEITFSMLRIERYGLGLMLKPWRKWHSMLPKWWNSPSWEPVSIQCKSYLPADFAEMVPKFPSCYYMPLM